MGRLSQKEEQRLVAAVEQSIEAVNSGMSPSAAIEKVARQEKYTPPFIRQMVAAFNKSASIARFTKEAAPEKRKASFELADAGVICRSIYPQQVQLTEKIACTVPVQEIRSTMMEKAAHAMDEYSEYRKLSIPNMIARVEKCRSAYARMDKTLRDKEASARLEFERSVDRLAGHASRLSIPDFQKFARLTLNGFPRTGDKMLKLISLKTRRELPEGLQKTAAAAVFPAKEPYFSLADAHVCAETWVRAARETQSFVKYAEGFVNNALDSLGSTLSDAAGLLSSKSDRKEVAKTKSPELDLDPQFFNALKEVDTRKAFADLALYDPDLKQHDIPTLIAAFNSAVQSVPEAATSTPVLKTLMLQRINTGNLQDTFQIGQEQVLSEKLLKKTQGARAALDMAKEKLRASTEGAQSWWEKDKTKTVKDKKEGGILSKLLEAPAKSSDKGKEKPAAAGDEKSMNRLIALEMTKSDGKPVNLADVSANLRGNGLQVSARDIDVVLQKVIRGETLEGDDAKVYDVFKSFK